MALIVAIYLICDTLTSMLLHGTWPQTICWLKV